MGSGNVSAWGAPTSDGRKTRNAELSLFQGLPISFNNKNFVKNKTVRSVNNLVNQLMAWKLLQHDFCITDYPPNRCIWVDDPLGAEPLAFPAQRSTRCIFNGPWSFKRVFTFRVLISGICLPRPKRWRYIQRPLKLEPLNHTNDLKLPGDPFFKFLGRWFKIQKSPPQKINF